jgi:hypothetical protein
MHMDTERPARVCKHRIHQCACKVGVPALLGKANFPITPQSRCGKYAIMLAANLNVDFRASFDVFQIAVLVPYDKTISRQLIQVSESLTRMHRSKGTWRCLIRSIPLPGAAQLG